jgi:transitional endoplasmic reticulum ATPase
MWFGESEANVRSLFDKARAAAPCILFFDEMDSIAKARSGSSGGSEAGDRVMNQILAEIDAVGQKNVFVIGATNRPDILDPAVTRPGRLDQLIHIPLPDRDSRLSVFQASLRKAPLDPKVNLEKLADFTEGFSGADISEICQRAAKNAVKDAVRREQAGEAQLPFVSKEHFEEAVSRARKSIPQSEIDRYNSFDESMKTSAKSTATQVFSFAQKGWVSAADASTPPGDAPSSSSEEPSYP